MTGVDDGEFWAWQTTESYVNGLGYEFVGVLGYQMPLFVDMIGVMGDFMTIELSAFAELANNKTNTLTVLATIASRRSFATAHEKEKEEPYLVKSGREWYFDGISFS